MYRRPSGGVKEAVGGIILELREKIQAECTDLGVIHIDLYVNLKMDEMIQKENAERKEKVDARAWGMLTFNH